MSSISSFFSSFFPTVYNDSEEKSEDKKEEEAAPPEEAQAEAAEEEAEEEEPEDEHPKIREECQNSAKCAQLTKHFEHCQEKVRGGEGFKGEDCVEELCTMMHCADECAAPKLFAKLR
ncbi:ubiquinol-cytochrome c reductase complex 17 kd protein [Moniliophthora roreri MCA 2997]|uniref:Ubiquinol-cytochrome c reductase complex 17 kd protein n=1 Tax=Moniliophthora roreri (strain MCA 2997) TaxID=1381753 RepID=V2XUC9_MONRO|nr:ubiquinol-cytochrome c reductase complex 17 kd protein [Moniliophthora roreri MCA 2997]